VQQGCRLAPLLFALVLKILTTELGVSIPELKLNMWFLDDGHLVGKAADLVRCLEKIKRVGEPLGLFLNLPKRGRHEVSIGSSLPMKLILNNSCVPIYLSFEYIVAPTGFNQFQSQSR
jgi:hypothetical protein